MPESEGNRPQPRALVVATVRWPSAARLAGALTRAGFGVDAVYPTEHPLAHTRSVQRDYGYSPLDPLGSLSRAIVDAKPDLVVPCDDRAVNHLQQIFEREVSDTPRASLLRSVIGRSLGGPSSYATSRSRIAILNLAAEAGIRVPRSVAISGTACLQDMEREIPLPWVLKVDGTWGGGGVKLARTVTEAIRFVRWAAWARAAQRVHHLVVRRDYFVLRELLQARKPSITLQQYIDGTPATALAVCWQGEVVAQIGADVLASQGALGASTVVKIADRPVIAEAVRRLVERLHLSGFCGLDFMSDRLTGDDYFIEANFRNTQLGHFNLGNGGDLAAALYGRVTNTPLRSHPLTTTSDVIAFFPQSDQFSGSDAAVHGAYLDIPYDEPQLVRELFRKPYHERGLAARFLGRFLQPDLAASQLRRKDKSDRNVTSPAPRFTVTSNDYRGLSAMSSSGPSTGLSGQPRPKRLAIVLQTHFIDRSILRLFRKLQAESPPGAEAVILLHVKAGTPVPEALANVPHHFVTTPEIRYPEYPNKSAIGREWHIWKGGHTDLSALHFYRARPDFDQYWFIEYDCCFSGDWRAFFSAFETSNADLITTSLRRASADPEWMHWWTLSVPGQRPPLSESERVCGFMPIFGVSRRGLEVVDRAYREGWTGHCEATWPTIMNLAALQLEDIGGDGEFVAPGNNRRFYTNTLSSPTLSPGSLVMRPARCWTGSARNQLWHPIKPPMFKLREDARSAMPAWVKRLVRARRQRVAGPILIGSPLEQG